MPQLKFPAKHRTALANGDVRQAIRPIRNRPVVAGDKLHLYAGAKFTGEYKVTVVNCAGAVPIELFEWGIGLDGMDCEWSDQVAEYLAHLDGFESAEAMRQFFESRFPFSGQLIYW